MFTKREFDEVESLKLKREEVFKKSLFLLV